MELFFNYSKTKNHYSTHSERSGYTELDNLQGYSPCSNDTTSAYLTQKQQRR